MFDTNETRDWVTPEHGQFSQSIRKLFASDLIPHQQRWRDQGHADRDFWRKAGEAGLLGGAAPTEYGGSGAGLGYDAVVLYETALAGETSWGFIIHTVVLHYLLAYGTDAQKADWAPRLIDGSALCAIAMTEPDGGTDLLGMRTTARRDGDDYLLNGSKTYITNGTMADFIIVAARTQPGRSRNAVTLFILDANDAPGFSRGPAMKKIGIPGSDTCELFFDDVRLPASSVLGGEPDQGFGQMMTQLVWERVSIGVKALGAIDLALSETLTHVRDRRMFEKRLMDFQNTRFRLAEAKARTEMLRSFILDAIGRAEAGTLDSATATMVKYLATEMQNEVINSCLQLHGGAGYMLDSTIARAFVDARVQMIYGGSNETMKELIAKSLDVQNG